MSDTLTVSIDDQDQEPRSSGPEPYLVLALHCQAPRTAGARVSLSDLDELWLARGAELAVHTLGRSARMQIHDRWMSSSHARLVRDGRHWLILDEGAKNGTYVNGSREHRAFLVDGDVVETGSSVFVFRCAGDVAEQPIFRDGEPPALHTFSARFAKRLRGLRRIATSDIPAIILGESGTGKELTARAVHELSGRSGAFVPVNCGALPRELVESELFGHRKGAFSGAIDDNAGLVRAADGGTLFLDEIAELPEASQVALLRVLQEGEVRAVGDTRSHAVNVRVVAATHQDLEALVERGEFRQDLYARLAGFSIELPPLRERLEDLGLLVPALLRKVAGGAQPTISRPAARALLAYRWPLNIRELEHALAAAAALCGNGEIQLDHLPKPVRSGSPTPAPMDLPTGDRALRDELVRQLTEHAGNISAVARAMGKARVQIRRWCKRLDVDWEQYRRV